MFLSGAVPGPWIDKRRGSHPALVGTIFERFAVARDAGTR